MEATTKENIDAHVHENIDSKITNMSWIPEVIRSIPEDEDMLKESLYVLQLMKVGILLTPTDIEDDDVLIDRATLEKRVVKKSAVLCSPYIQKEVDMKHKVSRIEAKVSNRLFLVDGEPKDPIFITKSGTFIFRTYMETLIPENWISTKVIDCWMMVLNSEEPYIANDSSFRLYLPVSFVSSRMLESTYSDEVNIRVLSNAFGARLKLLKIKYILKVKIVFFPFIVMGVLKLLKHPIADHVVFDDSKIPEFKWQTSYNGNDCGVFLMIHMESLKGTSLTRWTCGIVKESIEQKRQLNRLRRKYATKILLSDLNLKKDEVFKEAEIFDQKSFDSKTFSLIDSFSWRKERMKLL